MKIALFGYGKMGKIIEKIAITRGHSIVLKINENIESYDITVADIAIDFSTPQAAAKNISKCIKNGIPIVSGTTGWLNDYENIVSLCNEHNGAFIYASNFSLGVIIFYELNKTLAKLMQDHSQYKIEIQEIHHTNKLDAPSGTAITLAEDIIDNSNYKEWQLGESNNVNIIPIHAKRVDEIPGTHIINYKSSIDKIVISHEANNREGFGLGAVIASEWLLGKTGIFTMKDVLNIG